MVSSDEEGEIFSDTVTEYEFVNQANEHISLTCLPLSRQKDEIINSGEIKVFLSGYCDDGLLKIYKEIVAWKYELSYALPEISVLSKGSRWVKLLKPRRLYEPMFRSILITVHCLHFVKHNLKAAEESMWSHLARVFSHYEVAPSEVDCMNHIPLIRDAADHDQSLKDSELIGRLLSGQPLQSNVLPVERVPVDKPEFIADEDTDDPSEDDELSEEEEGLFDTCCSLCDNGGDILCCEGRCLRSFHACRQTGSFGEEICAGLGFSETQVKALPNFICKNCKYQRHQCFICGKLGSSDITSNAEVFPCVAGNCGRYYHPKCVSKELQQRNDNQIENLEEKIAEGESFVCPAHRCFSCKQLENRAVPEMQFAVCRRCPKSYHRKCLPREIVFDTKAVMEILPRAWDGLLPKRILLYCLDHEIDPLLGTPLRNHICFPNTVKSHTSEKLLAGLAVAPKKTRTDYSNELSKTPVGDTQKQAAREPTSFNVQKAYSSKLLNTSTAHLKHLSKPCASTTGLGADPSIRHSKIISDKKMYASKPGNANLYREKLNALESVRPHFKKQRASSPVDDSNPVADMEMERRITALIEKVESSFGEKEFLKQQKLTSMYNNSSKDLIDKNLTKGKVEDAVRSVREALQKLDNGGSVEDAKAVCSVDMLRKIPVWKNKLKLYITPFIHGMHYSSYGRHFTKKEKLHEIVDRLHHYVQDGDMIVDFCCGSNDFSCLMKEKLDRAGKKKCSFKNFDLFPTKNDFNFEQKDWFTVDPRDLPPGSQLVMGLNPPFGYKATLANKFINKALQFKPKLLILIVPPETQRLDRMNCKNRHHLRYDLIWEDSRLLSGQSFYFPGAFDESEQQISQWNNITPPLYLWSHPDWTRKHREIANRYCHSVPCDNLPNCQTLPVKHLPEEHKDVHRDFVNVYGNLPNVVDDIPVPMDKIYGQPLSSAYGHPSSGAYGHPMSDAYSHPSSHAYGHSTSNVYGHHTSHVYGHHASSIYERPISHAYGRDISNDYGRDMNPIYSQSGPAFDNYSNVQRAEYPAPMETGQSTVDKYAFQADIEISPTSTPF
ncbi:hypothetical protein vseg_015407 [Gypsophila vaccaria]